MNFRNIFRRETGEAVADVSLASEPAATPDTTDMQTHLPAHSNESGAECDSIEGTSNANPWYTSRKSFITKEIDFMSILYPQFTLRILDDPQSTLNGSLCWHGLISLGIMDDMEWEIVAVYQGLGGGKGDWSGILSVYFCNPTCSQIIATLGYVPDYLWKDGDGEYSLCAPHISGRAEEDIKTTMEATKEYCGIIEKICTGTLPENYLNNNHPSLSIVDGQ